MTKYYGTMPAVLPKTIPPGRILTFADGHSVSSERQYELIEGKYFVEGRTSYPGWDPSRMNWAAIEVQEPKVECYDYKPFPLPPTLPIGTRASNKYEATSELVFNGYSYDGHHKSPHGVGAAAMWHPDGVDWTTVPKPPKVECYDYEPSILPLTLPIGTRTPKGYEATSELVLAGNRYCGWQKAPSGVVGEATWPPYNVDWTTVPKPPETTCVCCGEVPKEGTEHAAVQQSWAGWGWLVGEKFCLGCFDACKSDEEFFAKIRDRRAALSPALNGLYSYSPSVPPYVRPETSVATCDCRRCGSSPCTCDNPVRAVDADSPGQEPTHLFCKECAVQVLSANIGLQVEDGAFCITCTNRRWPPKVAPSRLCSTPACAARQVMALDGHKQCVYCAHSLGEFHDAATSRNRIDTIARSAMQSASAHPGEALARARMALMDKREHMEKRNPTDQREFAKPHPWEEF